MSTQGWPGREGLLKIVKGGRILRPVTPHGPSFAPWRFGNENMKHSFKTFVCAGLAAALCFSLSGCGGDDDGFDYGDNDPNLVVCLGDSLTQGYHCIGAPYPTRLAQMSGKTVLNYGVAGAHSEYGASIVGSALSRRPGTVCIMFGSNDVVHGRDMTATKANLRAIVTAAKANGSKVILAVPPRMSYSHAKFDHRVGSLAEHIRALAKEEGVKLVDFYKAFGEQPERYLNPEDGLHLSDEGGEFVAKKFNSRI